MWYLFVFIHSSVEFHLCIQWPVTISFTWHFISLLSCSKFVWSMLIKCFLSVKPQYREKASKFDVLYSPLTSMYVQNNEHPAADNAFSGFCTVAYSISWFPWLLIYSNAELLTATWIYTVYDFFTYGVSKYFILIAEFCNRCVERHILMKTLKCSKISLEPLLTDLLIGQLVALIYAYGCPSVNFHEN